MTNENGPGGSQLYYSIYKQIEQTLRPLIVTDRVRESITAWCVSLQETLCYLILHLYYTSQNVKVQCWLNVLSKDQKFILIHILFLCFCSQIIARLLSSTFVIACQLDSFTLIDPWVLSRLCIYWLLDFIISWLALTLFSFPLGYR